MEIENSERKIFHNLITDCSIHLIGALSLYLFFLNVVKALEIAIPTFHPTFHLTCWRVLDEMLDNAVFCFCVSIQHLI